MLKRRAFLGGLGALLAAGRARANYQPSWSATNIGLLGPLKISNSNTRYFMRPDGKCVYLNGSHSWPNQQDIMAPGSTQAFDWIKYVDWLQANNHSCVRLWTSEHPVQTFPGFTNWTITPNWAYQRTGPGNAADGLLKFNLSLFNQAYFDRQRARIQAAQARGIYVSIMLFNGWSLDSKSTPGYAPWPVHPYNSANNINSINGDPLATGTGLQCNKLSTMPTGVLALQHAYVDKIIDTINDLNNVIFEVSNEADSTSTAWQEDIIAHVRAYEATKPFQHMIGFTPQTNAGTTVPQGSDADWFSPTDTPVDWFTTPQPATGDKVCFMDTDHITGVGGTATYIWEAFLLGSNCWYMETLRGLNVCPPTSPAFADETSGRLGISQTGRYAKRLNLNNAVPTSGLSSTGYCMSWTNNQYIVLRTATSGAFTLNLSGAPSKVLNVEWLNVNADTVTPAGTVTGGSSAQSFTAPFSDVAVLFLF